MNLELLEKMLQRKIDESTTDSVQVVPFTPSVMTNTRYVGVKCENGKEFLITIEEV